MCTRYTIADQIDYQSIPYHWHIRHGSYLDKRTYIIDLKGFFRCNHNGRRKVFIRQVGNCQVLTVCLSDKGRVGFCVDHICKSVSNIFQRIIFHDHIAVCASDIIDIDTIVKFKRHSQGIIFTWSTAQY